jgi:hypothetical protein
MTGKCVLDMVRHWDSYNHSGASHKKCLAIFNRVINFKPLTSLTDDPNEWQEVSSGKWQNIRMYSAFSMDGGKTYYDIDTKKVPFWKFWIKKNKENKLQIFKTLKSGKTK